MSDYPEDLKYSTEHEWVRSGNGNSVRVGITEYAADQLGDIVFVSLPEVGDAVAAGDACGELESTKSSQRPAGPAPRDHQLRPVRGWLALRTRARRECRRRRPAGC